MTFPMGVGKVTLPLLPSGSNVSPSKVAFLTSIGPPSTLFIPSVSESLSKMVPVMGSVPSPKYESSSAMGGAGWALISHRPVESSYSKSGAMHSHSAVHTPVVSSHCSPGSTTPSPHLVQSARQPSGLLTRSSEPLNSATSQRSPPSMTPLPQGSPGTEKARYTMEGKRCDLGDKKQKDADV